MGERPLGMVGMGMLVDRRQSGGCGFQCGLCLNGQMNILIEIKDWCELKPYRHTRQTSSRTWICFTWLWFTISVNRRWHK